MMELMNGVSQEEAARPKYETATLPIERLVSNPANLYSMEGIDELADSILLAGRVLQNIVVKSADEQGRYMVISGHRRLAACKKLVEEGHDEFGEITALVENEADENLRELMLIYTNSTSRVLTDAEKMRQAQKATEILKNLKAQGKFEGRIREAVSRMLNTTGAQLARYSAIDNNLTNPELREAFEDGRLGVSAAYEASGLSDDKQQKIADKLQDEGEVSIQDVKEVKGQDREETWPALYPGTEEEIPSVTVKIRDIDIKKKYKVTISISYLERDGMFYAGYDYQTHDAGGGCNPDPEHHRGYHSVEDAVEDTLIFLARRNKEIWEALWGSGYEIVGEPDQKKEEPATEEPAAEEPPVESKVAAAEAKFNSQGYEALTDCEKCKLTTRCEDCCRTCPPEKRCNVGQCQIESRKETERIIREQEENNALVTKQAKAHTEDETEPDDDIPSNPQMYAAKAVLQELMLLKERYQGAVKRHIAMSGDGQGKENLEATVDRLEAHIQQAKLYMENLEHEEEIRNSIYGSGKV